LDDGGDKAIINFYPGDVQLSTAQHKPQHINMSSVKRRKVDGDVPSGVKEKKANPPQAEPASDSSSHESEEPEAQPQEQEAAKKSFKDLVTSMNSKYTGII